jgi:ribose transport system permease protein
MPADSAIKLGLGRPELDDAVRSGSDRPWWRFFLTNEFGLIVLIVVFAAIFSVATPGFTSRFSLYGLGRTMAIDATIGFAMMVVIVTGGLNLSIGAIGVSAVMFAGWLMQGLGLPLPVGILGAFALGAALGCVNGVAIVKSGVHSFIITLATMSIFFGFMIWLTQAQAYRELPPEVAALGKARFAGGYVLP